MLNEDLKTVLLHNYQNRINKDDDFDINSELEKLLNDIGYSTADAGGEVTFYGKDPIQPSTLRIASLAGIGLAAKSVALASLWQNRGGNGQDIYVDIRKALKRLSPFYERKWETLNGFPAKQQYFPNNPTRFSFYQTKDNRWVMPLTLTQVHIDIRLNLSKHYQTSSLSLMRLNSGMPKIWKNLLLKKAS